MFFTYIAISIWMYSLQRQKPQMVEVSPVVNEKIVNSKQKKSEPEIVNSEEIGVWLEESDILENEDNENNQDVENVEEYYDPEIYEEITFQDDFDKEYRDDVWDSYFEDIEETIIPDTPEVAENTENILE